MPEVSDSASGTPNKAPFVTDFILLKPINELLISWRHPELFYTDVVRKYYINTLNNTSYVLTVAVFA